MDKKGESHRQKKTNVNFYEDILNRIQKYPFRLQNDGLSTYSKLKTKQQPTNQNNRKATQTHQSERERGNG